MSTNEQDYSIEGLIQYCESLGSSGRIPGESARALRTAVRLVLGELSPDEQMDVRKIDVGAAIEKYGNTAQVSKNTLQAYGSRIRTALAAFLAQAPKQTPEEKRPESQRVLEAQAETAQQAACSSPDAPIRVEPSRRVPTRSAMTLQIPVRSDFVAQLVLPYDLTQSEANRLCRLIEVLPMDTE
jgi:hypothetical protein